MLDGRWFAWYPVPTYVFWSKGMYPGGWVWLRYVGYRDTIFSGRVYTKMSTVKKGKDDD